MTSVLLQVRDLSVEFDSRHGRTHAVRGVSFDVAAGEMVGVVGESGCGKSVTARALLGLVDAPGQTTRGTVRLDGEDLLTMPPRALRAVRGRRIAMVFQDPMTSLNPVFTIGQQLVDVMRAHGHRAPRTRALELLEQVEIPAAALRLRQYPHELSGGMRQRVMIAMALANEPALIVADEPTTALDLTIQAQILDLLRRINREQGTAIMLISHSLGVVSDVAERVLVFYAGRIVEAGPTAHVFRDPQHPYTQALLGAHAHAGSALAGTPPSLTPPPPGCAFAARCPHSIDRCRDDDPAIVALNAESRHAAACWLVEQRNEQPVVNA